MTMPLTGARISVRAKSTLDCANMASRCFTAAATFSAVAFATSTCACAALTCSAKAFAIERALSTSAPEIKFLSRNCSLRSTSRRASCQFTSACDKPARWAAMMACCVKTCACAASTSACA